MQYTSFFRFLGFVFCRKPKRTKNSTRKRQSEQKQWAYSVFVCINRWCNLILQLIFYSFYFLTVVAKLPFCLFHCHIMSPPHPRWACVLLPNSTFADNAPYISGESDSFVVHYSPVYGYGSIVWVRLSRFYRG